jgi:hypothetical protein
MVRVVIMMAALLAACHAGFGVGDSGRHPTYVASSALDSAVAQASIGTYVSAGD